MAEIVLRCIGALGLFAVACFLAWLGYPLVRRREQGESLPLPTPVSSRLEPSINEELGICSWCGLLGADLQCETHNEPLHSQCMGAHHMAHHCAFVRRVRHEYAER